MNGRPLISNRLSQDSVSLLQHNDISTFADDQVISNQLQSILTNSASTDVSPAKNATHDLQSRVDDAQTSALRDRKEFPVEVRCVFK